MPSFSFTTSLTGAALNNLAPGTDITGTVSPFIFQPNGFQHDDAGFPIGGAFGTSYFHVTSGPTVQIGTNAAGQITSWNIFENIFASYPAFPGENPNDFFSTYTVATTNAGDTVVLIQDHNAGFGPDVKGSGAGTFGAVAAVPEPSTWAMMILGFAGIGFMAYRRRPWMA